jgi:hypothetical protein
MGNTHHKSNYQNRTTRSMPFGPYDTKIKPNTAQRCRATVQTTQTFQAEIESTLPQFWIQRTLRPGEQQRGKWPRGRSAAAQERPQQGRGGNPERRKQHAPPGRESQGEGTGVGGIRPLQTYRKTVSTTTFFLHESSVHWLSCQTHLGMYYAHYACCIRSVSGRIHTIYWGQYWGKSQITAPL